MFQFTQEPSSGSYNQCLAKITSLVQQWLTTTVCLNTQYTDWETNCYLKKMEQQAMEQHNRKWVTFAYHIPSKRKVTNLFKRTNLEAPFRPTNTIYQQPAQKSNNANPSGI